VWTPKRIFLLVLGFSLFCGGYFTYSYVFGALDGLPPLPGALLEPLPDDGTMTVEPRRTSTTDAKLGMAFGLECSELKRAIKLELKHNNMVLATDSFQPDDKGRLVLRPFSIAVFGKPKADGKDVEINTIRADVAYLTLDKPINKLINPNELNGRKITSAELNGNIEIINNRRTVRRDDDLELFIKTGPLYYDEGKHLVWTYDAIHMTDRQSKPKPHEVWGKGMEMELLVETPPPPQPGQPHQHQQKQESITGVKRITLQSNVEMHLYVDGHSGFMNESDKKQAAKPQPAGNAVEKPRPDARDTEAKAADAEEKAHLQITTPGRFNYLFFKDYDMAHFEVTPGTPAPPVGASTPQDVIVLRQNPITKKIDHLICQVLDLRLLRKENKETSGAKGAKTAPATPPAPAKNEQPEGDQSITIEWVHATAPNGMVTLTSDQERLTVTEVDDLQYDARTKVTTLKSGQRLKAVKDDDKGENTLFARELNIQEKPVPNSDKTYQHALATGPGQIDILDKKTNKVVQHAYWNDLLTSTKDERTLTAKGEMQDLLILTGKARFVDDEHAQSLQADTLKVWFSPAEKPAVENATPAPAPAANSSSTLGPASGVKAEHIEALGHVVTDSRQLTVHDTARLVVWFRDAPPSQLPAPQELDAQVRTTLPPQAVPPPVPGDVPQPLPAGPALTPSSPAKNNPVVVDAAKPVAADAAKPAHAAAGEQPASQKKTEEPARPVDLSARSIEAWVLRETTKEGPKETLEKLWAEGLVHVTQEPAKPGDKGVDITGDRLNLIYHIEGDELTVFANEENLARLQMDKILILGPEVHIDQVANKAWVVGPGAMEIDSETSLSGKPLEEREPLKILWQKSMLVHGIYAEFNVGIQAEQQQHQLATADKPATRSPAKMACNTLRVYFDKPISLKEGNNKGEESPKVQSLLCDQNARVSEETYENGNKLVKYTRLEATTIQQLTLAPPDEDPHNPAKKDAGNELRASAPGWLIVVQQGGIDPLEQPAEPKQPGKAGKPAPKPAAKPADDQLKLTLVEFAGSMYANSKTNFASFRKNVRVINLPVDDPFKEVDIDVTLSQMPDGATYLSCQHLEVYTREENGKKYQEMHAYDQAAIQSKLFWGRAAVIHFDEAKDQVIFDSSPGCKATLYKFGQVGGKPQQVRGDKIIYHRKSGEFDGVNISEVQAE
jgi:hypothetical protein